MMRRLVQAGVLSASAVSAAVRLHAGQVMMAQANRELPQGVREALGDGLEVGAMHETEMKDYKIPMRFTPWRG